MKMLKKHSAPEGAMRCDARGRRRDLQVSMRCAAPKGGAEIITMLFVGKAAYDNPAEYAEGLRPYPIIYKNAAGLRPDPIIIQQTKRQTVPA